MSAPASHVLGVVLVASLTVGGGFVGRALAPADPAPSVVVAEATIASPQVTPVQASELIRGGDETRKVQVGATIDSIHADVASLLTAAASMVDPQAAAERLAARYGLLGPDDPCKVASDRCPDGVRVSARGAGVPVRVWRAAVDPACGPLTGGNSALSVITNGVATATVEYWSAFGPLASVTQTVAAAGVPTCVRLHDLDPRAVYSVHVEVVAPNGTRDSRDLSLDASGAPVRPPTAVYAVTDDLIAMTVPHRPGERVEVFPSVVIGDEASCDPVVVGFDLLARALPTITTTVAADDLADALLDERFTERTTFPFDINEGLTVLLCAVVTPLRLDANAEPNYIAQTIVRTADRLVPSVTVESVSGEALPGWAVTGYQHNGVRCGSVPLPTDRTYGQVSLSFTPSRTLCDTADTMGSPEFSLMRGVLPFSAGSVDAFTVELASQQSAPERTSLDLGAPARCTGSCVIPEPSYYPVVATRASAVVKLAWTQGNINGAPTTSVARVTDSLTPALPGPELDVATAHIRQSDIDLQTPSAGATVMFRADEAVAYVARVLPLDGHAMCVRPNGVIEATGTLAAGDGWTPMAAARFSGLCVGTSYRIEVELTAADGSTSTWREFGGAREWGPSARLTTMSLPVPLAITYSIEQPRAGDAAFVTLRTSDQTLLGPRAGSGCAQYGTSADAVIRRIAHVGETMRFSGSVQSVPLRETCDPDWSGSRLADTFAVEIPLSQLTSPDGVMISVGEGDHQKVIIRLTPDR
jgi:hypothetical protein